MNLFKAAFTVLFLLLISPCFSQQNAKLDCSSSRSGKFKCLDAEDTTTYVIMNEEKQVSYSRLNPYTIESKIVWITDCSYNMEITKITIPDFPFKPGDVMNVVIDKVEGDIIYYTCTFKGMNGKGRFKKLDR